MNNIYNGYEQYIRNLFFMAGVNKKVSVTTASTPIITASFRTAVIQNNGTAGIVWLRIGQSGDAVVGEGVGLNPGTSTAVGGSFGINDGSLTQGIVTAISSAGTNSVAIYYI